MKITDLNPQIVWTFFHTITQIPRPSKQESRIIGYLESFAGEHHLAIRKDAAGNVLISKPATPGYEGLPVGILQSHVDMVCEKNAGVIFFNFQSLLIVKIQQIAHYLTFFL